VRGPPNGDDLPAIIPDGKHQAMAVTVILALATSAAVVFALHEYSGRDAIFNLEAVAVDEVMMQRVPRIGRVADAELFERLGRKAATPRVITCFLTFVACELLAKNAAWPR
jgi:hypothetical protein